MDILKQLYQDVVPLHSWLSQIWDATKDGPVPDLILENDPQSYRSLLITVYVGALADLKMSCFTSSQLSNLKDVVLRAIERNLKKKSHIPNILTLGCCLRSTDIGAHTGQGDVEIVYPNSCINTLLSKPWQILHSRIGDTLLLFLLQNTSLFLEIEPTCFIQLSGTPVYNILSEKPLAVSRCNTREERKKCARSMFDKSKNNRKIVQSHGPRKSGENCKNKSERNVQDRKKVGNSTKNNIPDGKLRKRKFEIIDDSKYEELRKQAEQYAKCRRDESGEIYSHSSMRSSEGGSEKMMITYNKEMKMCDRVNDVLVEATEYQFDPVRCEKNKTSGKRKCTELDDAADEFDPAKRKYQALKRQRVCLKQHQSLENLKCAVNETVDSNRPLSLQNLECDVHETASMSTDHVDMEVNHTVNCENLVRFGCSSFDVKALESECNMVIKTTTDCSGLGKCIKSTDIKATVGVVKMNRRGKDTKTNDDAGANIVEDCEMSLVGSVKKKAEENDSLTMLDEGISRRNRNSKKKQNQRSFKPFDWGRTLPRHTYLYRKNPREKIPRYDMLQQLKLDAETLVSLYENIFVDAEVFNSSRETIHVEPPSREDCVTFLEKRNSAEASASETDHTRRNFEKDTASSTRSRFSNKGMSESEAVANVCDDGSNLSSDIKSDQHSSHGDDTHLLNFHTPPVKRKSVGQVTCRKEETETLARVCCNSKEMLLKRRKAMLLKTGVGNFRDYSLCLNSVEWDGYTAEETNMDINTEHSTGSEITVPVMPSTSGSKKQTMLSPAENVKGVMGKDNSQGKVEPGIQMKRVVTVGGVEKDDGNDVDRKKPIQEATGLPNSGSKCGCDGIDEGLTVAEMKKVFDHGGTTNSGVNGAESVRDRDTGAANTHQEKSATDIDQIDDAGLHEVVRIPFMGDVMPVLADIIKNHRKCPYKALLNQICPSARGKKSSNGKKKKGVEEAPRCLPALLQKHTAPRQVFLFLRRCILKTFPLEVFGCVENKNSVLRNLSRMLRAGRFDKLSLGQLMSGLKTKPVSWLKCFHSNSIRLHLLAKLVYWVFTRYIFILLKTYFYVTDTTFLKYRLLYYRQAAWTRIQYHGIMGLIKQKTLKPIPKEEATRMVLTEQSLGVSALRFLPKEKSLRPIINMGYTDRQTADKNMSINKQLFSLYRILSYVKDRKPSLLGYGKLGTDDIYRAWSAFAEKWSRLGRPRLFFVKTDISRCYDSIIQRKLFDILENILQQELKDDDEVVVRKYMMTQVGRGTVKTRFVRQVEALSTIDADFISFARELVQGKHLKDVILMDKVVYQHETRDRVLEKLHQHLFHNIVKVGSLYYQQHCGISQGSIISTLLCSFYYADMERHVFSLNPDDFQLRIVDDYMYISPSLDRAQGFLQQLMAGFPQYNCQVNVEKVLTNFPCRWFSRITSDWFPWCGLMFNTRTLEVGVDYSRLGGVRIEDTMTFDLSSHPGAALQKKILFSASQKCHAIFLDGSINSRWRVLKNIYLVFLVAAFKLHSYVRKLPHKQRAQNNTSFFLGVVQSVGSLVYWHYSKAQKLVSPGHELPICKDSIMWICLHAFLQKLQKFSSQYSPLLKKIKIRRKSVGRMLGTEVVNSLQDIIEEDLPDDFKLIL